MLRYGISNSKYKEIMYYKCNKIYWKTEVEINQIIDLNWNKCW